MTEAGNRPAPDPVGARRNAQQLARRHREISSADLFGGNREIQIRHANEVYTLRQTSKGKLILTK
jgi:hemin uptake protein HemP